MRGVGLSQRCDKSAQRLSQGCADGREINQKCANASENDENPCGVRGCRKDATKVHRGCRKDARKMHREEGEKQEGEKQESGLAAALFEKMK